MTKNDQTNLWSKPELTKLGTLKDVAGGSSSGNDSNGNGQGANQAPNPS